MNLHEKRLPSTGFRALCLCSLGGRIAAGANLLGEIYADDLLEGEMDKFLGRIVGQSIFVWAEILVDILGTQDLIFNPEDLY